MLTGTPPPKYYQTSLCKARNRTVAVIFGDLPFVQNVVASTFRSAGPDAKSSLDETIRFCGVGVTGTETLPCPGFIV